MNKRCAAHFGADTNARELFVNHPVGHGLDGVILRDRDANTALSSSMDGTREERLYYLQNYRGDVVRLISAASGGRQVEGARFSSYGVPWGISLRDIDGDGDVDSDDSDFMLAWSGSSYDVRGDFDLDGDVDFNDEIIFGANSDPALGWGSLSNFASRTGYAGYEHDGNFDTLAHVRNRVYASDLGRWTRRDPAGFVDGVNLYGYVMGAPIANHDPMGLARRGVKGSPTDDSDIRIPNNDDGTFGGGEPCTSFPCVVEACGGWCMTTQFRSFLAGPETAQTFGVCTGAQKRKVRERADAIHAQWNSTFDIGCSEQCRCVWVQGQSYSLSSGPDIREIRESWSESGPGGTCHFVIRFDLEVWMWGEANKECQSP